MLICMLGRFGQKGADILIYVATLWLSSLIVFLLSNGISMLPLELISIVDIELELWQSCQTLNWKQILKWLGAEHNSAKNVLLGLKPAAGQIENQKVCFPFKDQISH